MLICGIKLTHDAAIAVIKDSKLLFSIEFEKLSNNPRYVDFNMNERGFLSLLNDYGYEARDFDKMVIDGWHTEQHHRYIFEGLNLELAPYGTSCTGNIFDHTDFRVGLLPNRCTSYKHVAGHVLAAYCTSPFAKEGLDSFVLVWDGGMFPQLFYYQFRTNKIINVGDLFFLSSNIYPRFGKQFAAFGLFDEDLQSIAGKMMAFAALGAPHEELIGYFQRSIDEVTRPERIELSDIKRLDATFIAGLGISNLARKYSPPDIIISFQEAIGQLLIARMNGLCSPLKGFSRNICCAGGTALNITWNAAIRTSGIFERCWIPPFPSDSGSAIGTACCEMVMAGGDSALEWNVYSGPRLKQTAIRTDWERQPCSIGELAYLLHESGEPILFMNGQAELGPRALGNRSILAPATDRSMKHLLNSLKEREYYRPVAPVCLEEDAPVIFDPGTPDPYMLYTHHLRAEWKDVVPAIRHIDGTARLQTINESQNPQLYELLREYKQISGIPLLCNTSANFKGRGFFPDVASAANWGKIHSIWSEGYLYLKKGYSMYLHKAADMIVERS